MSDKPKSPFTSRKWRRDAAHHKYLQPTGSGWGPFDAIPPDVKGRIFIGKAGHYRHIEVKRDGSILIGAKAFIDDVVAFLVAAGHGNPTVSDEIKGKLVEYVDAMDARAVAKHAYDGNPDEAALDWNGPLDE